MTLKDITHSTTALHTRHESNFKWAGGYTCSIWA